MNRNYQKELEKLLAGLNNETHVPRLFLHACCAPCSSYVLEYLSEYFEITVFFYNPNISPEEEYEKRVEEIRRLIGEMDFRYPVEFVEGEYHPEEFFLMAKGLEKVPEGGERCFKCYRMRMEEAARLDGCNIPKTFLYVMMPLTRSSMVSLGIFTALFAFKELMWPMIVCTSNDMLVLSTALNKLQGQYAKNYPELMAASIYACLPMIVIYLIFQKQFVEGIATSGGKL